MHLKHHFVNTLLSLLSLLYWLTDLITNIVSFYLILFLYIFETGIEDLPPTTNNTSSEQLISSNVVTKSFHNEESQHQPKLPCNYFGPTSAIYYPAPSPEDDEIPSTSKIQSVRLWRDQSNQPIILLVKLRVVLGGYFSRYFFSIKNIGGEYKVSIFFAYHVIVNLPCWDRKYWHALFSFFFFRFWYVHCDFLNYYN